MNVLSFISRSIELRISQIENELDLIKAQIDVSTSSPGLQRSEVDILFLVQKIYLAIHNYLILYLSKLKFDSTQPCPLKAAVSQHIFVCDQLKIQTEKLLLEIQGHQSIIMDITGLSLDTNTDNPETLIKIMNLFYPYHIVIPRLQDGQFFTELLKAVLSYSPSAHKTTIHQIYRLIQSFDLDKYHLLAIAERFLSFFILDTDLKAHTDIIDCFQFAEHCRRLISAGSKAIGIDEDSISELEELRQKTISEQPDQFIVSTPSFERRSKLSIIIDSNPSIPALQHIVFEFRKIPIQSSVSSMMFILQRALDWLTACLTASNGKHIGADENFKFFVYCLCQSQIHNMPALLSFIDEFMLSDFRSARIGYLIAELKSGQEFIRTRSLPVPPLMVFPFPHSSILTLHSDQPLKLNGFAVYAFPTFSDQPFPALLQYTGNLEDEADAYQYEASPKCVELLNLLSIPTLNGSFFQLTPEMASMMIRVDGGVYREKEHEISILSALLVMVPQRIVKPNLNMIPKLTQYFNEVWNIEDGTSGVMDIVQKLQKSLKYLGYLKSNEDGFIGPETKEAWKVAVAQTGKNDFFISVRLFNFVMQKAGRKIKSSGSGSSK